MARQGVLLLAAAGVSAERSVCMRKGIFAGHAVMFAGFALISACAFASSGLSPLLTKSGYDVSDDKGILPPMPDRTANNATLAGICTTNTKVRDDVYRIIFSAYTSATKRGTAMKYAEVTRGIYLNQPKTKAEARAIADAQDKVARCLELHKEMSFKEQWEIMEGIAALHADTAARMEALDKYERLLHGQLFFSIKPTPDACKGILP